MLSFCFEIFQLGKLQLNKVEDDSVDIPSLSNEEIENLSPKRISSDIELMKVQLEDMKPDLSAINEYKKKVCHKFYFIFKAERR